MQRYRLNCYNTLVDGIEIRLEPDKDGEFVRYDDVEKELKRIAKLLATEQDDNHNPEGDDQ